MFSWIRNMFGGNTTVGHGLPTNGRQLYARTRRTAWYQPGGILGGISASLIIFGVLVFTLGISSIIFGIFSAALNARDKARAELEARARNMTYPTAPINTLNGIGSLVTDTVDYSNFFTKVTGYPVTLPLLTTGTPSLVQDVTLTRTTANRQTLTVLATPTINPIASGTVYSLPTGTLPLPLKYEASSGPSCGNEIGLGPCGPFLLGVEISGRDDGYVLTTFPQTLFDHTVLDYPIGNTPWFGVTTGLSEQDFAGTVKGCEAKIKRSYKIWLGARGEVWLHLVHTLTEPCVIEKGHGVSYTYPEASCECAWVGTLPF